MSEERADGRHGGAASPAFGGYHLTQTHEPNHELTRVGPGTPCGELMRRYWHPVALSTEATDLPRVIRILGEDLVLFRDLSGAAGLVHRHCPHRGASLEYGVCEAAGIRCCYHGWLFARDGTILETPGEPADSEPAGHLRERLRLGAYATHELKGIVFAYLGPPESQPVFPVYDTFDIPGVEMQPYTRDYPCNWLQITENAMDPVHAVFLHVRATGPQFDETWGKIGVREFHERETGFFYTNARRVAENVWVRLHEIILPNITHAGAVMSMDGRGKKYFGRNSFTRWVVPVDDETSRVIAWANFGERTDPPRPEWRSDRGIDVVESGMPMGRPAEEAQRFPGDYEAFVGQGKIAVHASEHLLPADQGVAQFRARLRRDIRALAKGTPPFDPAKLGPAPIPTYCGDTVMAVPQSDDDDEALVLQHSRRVLEIIRGADDLKGPARDEAVIRRLKDHEASLKS